MKQQFLDLMSSGERVVLDTACGAVRVVRAGAGAYAALVSDDELCEFAASPSVAVQVLCRRLGKSLDPSTLNKLTANRGAGARRGARR